MVGERVVVLGLFCSSGDIKPKTCCLYSEEVIVLRDESRRKIEEEGKIAERLGHRGCLWQRLCCVVLIVVVFFFFFFFLICCICVLRIILQVL